MIEKAEFQNYFRGQQVSLQWMPFLRAMAAEMSALSDVAELRNLFAAVGKRFASDSAEFFQEAKTLTALQDDINDLWARINWGWIKLKESDGYIEIVHNAAPLEEAFGEDALGWSVGFLEGFYQSVFGALGADESMELHTQEDLSDGMSLHFRFGL